MSDAKIDYWMQDAAHTIWNKDVFESQPETQISHTIATHCPYRWRPIESAPKDGRWILIIGDDWMSSHTAQWFDGEDGFDWYDDSGGPYVGVTHWMPLPPPPDKEPT